MNIKNIGERLIRTYIKLLYVPLKKVRSNAEELIGRELCRVASTDKYDMSLRIRPKDPSIKPILEYGTFNDIGIVLQGPLRLEDDFTLNTVKFYKRLYKGAKVIVSTWDSEDANSIEELEKCGAIVLKNKKPDYSGQLNLNYQIISSSQGIRRAVDEGCKYICKTRTDQRISKPYVLACLKDFLHRFPADVSNVQGRIITLGMNYGTLFYPYFMSDFFYFGFANDMKILFDGELDVRVQFKLKGKESRKSLSKMMHTPEVYLICSYLRKIGHSCEFTVKDFWYVMRTYFIGIDMRMIDLEWPKYENKYKEHIFFGEYFNDDSETKLKTANFDFITWYNLYSGILEYDEKYEKYSDVIF